MGRDLKTACDVAEFKYPSYSHSIAFILDQSSCHHKFDEKALIVRNILVKDGGPRRIRDTDWAGRPQSMVLPADDSAKGLSIRTHTGYTCRAMNTGNIVEGATLLSPSEGYCTTGKMECQSMSYVLG